MNRHTRIFNPTVGGAAITGLTGAATTNTDSFQTSEFSEMMLFIASTAHAGTTPTLDCKLQYSPDGTNWVDSGDAFTQITTTDGVFVKKASANFGKYCRLVFTVGGTGSPSYTFVPTVALKE